MAPQLIGQEGNILKFDLGNGQIIDVAKPGLSPDTLASFAAPLPPIVPNPAQELGIPQLNFTPGPEVASQPMSAPVDQPAVRPSAPAPDVGVKMREPAATDGLDFQAGKYSKAVDQETLAQMAINQKKAEMLGKQMADIDALDKKAAQKEEERQKKADLAIQGIKTAEDVAQNFKFEDPMGGVGGHVLAGVAMALGALGSSISGGPNMAQQIVYANIDRSLARQKANYEKLRDKVGTQKDMYSTLRAQFGDERLADQAYKLSYLQSAQLKMDQMAAESSNPLIKANAEKAKALFGVDIEKNKAELGAKYAELYAKQNKESDVSDRFVPGVGVLLTTKDAQDAKDLNEVTGRVFSNLGKLKKLREEYGAEFFNRDVVKEAKAIARDIQLDLKSPRLGQLGVLAGADLDILEDIIPSDPTKMGYVAKQLDTAENLIRNRVDQFYKARGATPSGDLLNQKGSVEAAGQKIDKAGAYEWWSKTKNSKDPSVQQKRDTIGKFMGFSD